MAEACITQHIDTHVLKATKFLENNERDILNLLIERDYGDSDGDEDGDDCEPDDEGSDAPPEPDGIQDDPGYDDLDDG